MLYAGLIGIRSAEQTSTILTIAGQQYGIDHKEYIYIYIPLGYRISILYPSRTVALRGSAIRARARPRFSDVMPHIQSHAAAL